MADETIGFNITDNGTTEALAAAMDALAEAGGQAFDNLTAELGNFQEGSAAALASIQAMGAYLASGGKANIGELSEAFQSLTAEQMEVVGTSETFIRALQNLGIAEQAAALNAKQLQESISTLNGSYASEAEGADQAAAAVKNVGAAQSSGATIATTYGTAHNSASAATKNGASAATSAQSAYKSLGTSIQTLTGYFGAYQTAALVVKDIDIADSISQQLKAVLGSAEAASDAFNKLGQTAVATQSPIADVARNFEELYSAVKESGTSAGTAETEIDTLAKVLFATGTSSQQAANFMRQFTEGMAQGGITGRQLTSMLNNNTAAINIFGQGLGVNVEALGQHAQAIQKSADKVTQLQAAQDSNTESVGKATAAYTSAETKYTSTTTKLGQEQTALVTLTNARGDHTVAIGKEQSAIEKSYTSITKEQAAIAADSNALGAAKATQAAATQAKIDAAKAANANVTALSTEKLQTELTSASFIAYVNGLAQGAGTISGAFTSLNNQFIIFLKNSNDASAVTKIFTTVLGDIGNNLNIVIPAITLFGGALVTLKVASVAKDLYTLAAAFTANTLAIGPELLIAGALAIAFGLLFSQTTAGQKALQTLTAAWPAIHGTDDGG